MASSLIRINEATEKELQTLHGIGPRRAAYIVEFRQYVAPISTALDLAAATGLGLKAAEALSRQIDWQPGDNHQHHAILPVVFLCLAAVWLIFTGFSQVAAEPFIAPASYFNVAIAILLLGTFTVIGDILVSYVRRTPSETSWIFTFAVILTSSGMVFLLMLTGSQVFISYDADFTASLNETMVFVFFCGMICWLIYAPALFLRRYIDDNQLASMATAEDVYNISLTIIPVVAGTFALLHPSKTWMEEIFSLWCLAGTSTAARELLRGHSAFVSVLQDADRNRFKFAWKRNFGETVSAEYRRYGLAASAGSAFLVFCLVTAVTRLF